MTEAFELPDDEFDIKEEDLSLFIEEDVIPDVETINSPKLGGKHSLEYDTIFKGKKENREDYEESYSAGNFNYDASSVYYEESFESTDYHRKKELEKMLYDIIKDKTDIDITTNRRKPSRYDFNKYFRISVDNLKGEGFSYCEIFSELSYYFSENTFNMFKLLNADWGEKILQELRDYKNLDFLDSMDFV